MKILIDLQGAQSTGSRTRGIGKYTISFVKAFVKNAENHEVILLLNGLFPDTIQAIVASFAGLLSLENIKIFDAVGPISALHSPAIERAAVELSREAYIVSLKPDFVVITSLIEGLTDDAVTSIGRFHRSIPTAVVHYDLIPYIYRSVYLANDEVEIWYERKLNDLRKADILLSISEASRRDAIELLQLDEEKVVNISSAVDDVFSRVDVSGSAASAVRNRYGIRGSFILYTGGIDHRKNIDTLIVAFAKLPSAMLETHQLVIVCSVQPDARERSLALAKDCGLPQSAIVFTGFIPENDLILLNNLCTLFVFPSLYEGFGLPVLEAMKCGAIVVASNSSSIREVVGFEEALFDPISADSIADKLLTGLTSEGFRSRFVEFSAGQICQFSWDSTAKRALKALELSQQHNRHAEGNHSYRNPSRRLRLAYVSPLPPEQSGIADFSAELLPELARHYDIDVIADQKTISDPWTRANAPIRSVAWLQNNADYYDRVLYHFGNSVFHSHMFSLVRQLPGVVVLHDFFLSGIQAHLQYNEAGGTPFFEELYYSHGYPALYELWATGSHTDVVYRYPCNYSVISQAVGVISHCEHAVKLGRRFYSDSLPDNWSVVPLARAAPRLASKTEARKRLGLGDDDFVICCFGIIGPTKLNDRLFEVWKKLKLSGAKNVSLYFVGANHGGDFGDKLAVSIERDGLGQVAITGWVDQHTYRNYLAAADIGVQLRTNSRGETSAAILDCLAAALPTIVNANGSMAELPANTVWKLPDEFCDEDLLTAIYSLLRDDEARLALSAKGREYLIMNHAPRVAATKYFDAIERSYNDHSKIRNTLFAEVSNLHGEFSKPALVAFARTMAANFKPDAWQRQILIDVTESASGVPSCALWDAIKKSQFGERIEPVYFDPAGSLRYARRYTLRALGITSINLPDDLVDSYEGDIFFSQTTSDGSHQALVQFRMACSGVSIRPIDDVIEFLSFNAASRAELDG